MSLRVSILIQCLWQMLFPYCFRRRHHFRRMAVLSTLNYCLQAMLSYTFPAFRWLRLLRKIYLASRRGTGEQR
jgi:hypothetical protein